MTTASGQKPEQVGATADTRCTVTDWTFLLKSATFWGMGAMHSHETPLAESARLIGN
jgi:hypothetical protein